LTSATNAERQPKKGKEEKKSSSEARLTLEQFNAVEATIVQDIEAALTKILHQARIAQSILSDSGIVHIDNNEKSIIHNFLIEAHLYTEKEIAKQQKESANPTAKKKTKKGEKTPTLVMTLDQLNNQAFMRGQVETIGQAGDPDRRTTQWKLKTMADVEALRDTELDYIAANCEFVASPLAPTPEGRLMQRLMERVCIQKIADKRGIAVSKKSQNTLQPSLGTVETPPDDIDLIEIDEDLVESVEDIVDDIRARVRAELARRDEFRDNWRTRSSAASFTGKKLKSPPGYEDPRLFPYSQTTGDIKWPDRYGDHVPPFAISIEGERAVAVRRLRADLTHSIDARSVLSPAFAYLQEQLDLALPRDIFDPRPDRVRRPPFRLRQS
jgi:hypothetical protein